MKKIAYYADHTDIYRHLASEELILDDLAPDTMVLYLWSASDAMVIGKNQNPWLECNLPLMAENNCSLARRISGGGAVYHDLGNLNYSVFLPKESYDRDAISAMVLAALNGIGIHGNVGERHLLEVNGRKFSGNAFCIRRDKVLHHGTLLVNADLGKLVDFARPTCEGIEAKGIRSVPSTVGNLSDHIPSLTCLTLRDAIFNEFDAGISPAPYSHELLAERAAYFESDAWSYHRTPRFIARGSLSDGAVTFEAEVVKGHIKRVQMDSILAQGQSLTGLDFRELLNRNPQLSLE